MKKNFRILIICFALTLTCGCMWSAYNITSEPKGATVIIDGNNSGKTPVEVYLYHRGEQTIIVQKDGYKETEAKVTPLLVRDYNKLHFDLEKEAAGQMLIEIIETAKGTELRSYKVHAERDVIERSPNVTAVHRVTDLSANRWIGLFTLSRDGENLLLEITDQEIVDNKQIMYSNIWALNPAVGGGMRRVTQGNCFDRHPHISATGEYLYFSSNRTGRYNIWRLSLKTLGGLGLVTSDATSDNYPVLSPNGNDLLYTAYMSGSSIPQLWTIPIGRGLPTQLREGKNGQWSADSKKILFTTQDRSTGAEKIWIMAADGSSPTQITYSSDYNDIHPRFSPDGSKIVFASDRGKSSGKSNYDIWIMNVDGSNPKQLTTNGSRDDFPVFSANGQSVYFRSNRGIKWDIWMMKLIE